MFRNWILTLSCLLVFVLSAEAVGARQAPSPASGRPTVVAARPAPGTLALFPERIPLKAGGSVTVERGTMYVSANRSNPKSDVIGLEVYRFKARSEAAPGTPPIFRLYGGPSFLGLAPDLARPGFYEADIEPFTKVADLVVVSQRGIGPSKPTTECEGLETRLDAPVTREEALAAVRELAASCKAYWEGQGLDLRGFTIRDAAADIDEVRRALGYRKITLWGVSFGSHWSMAVMRYYPESIERAVLWGMEGPDHTYDMPSDVLGSLSRMAAAADEAPQLRGLIPDGGLLAAFKAVIARVEKDPVRVTVPGEAGGKDQVVLFDAQRVRSLALGYSGRVASRQGMRTWPADVLALVRGDFTRAARAITRAGGGATTASFFSLDCGSGITPARKRLIDADPAASVLGEINLAYDAACPGWGLDLGDTFRKNFETLIPTVIAYGTWDVSTPQQNALELAPFFKKSRLVQVIGGSHGSLNDAMSASAAFRAAVMTFAATGDISGVPDRVDLPPIEWVVPKADPAGR